MYVEYIAQEDFWERKLTLIFFGMIICYNCMNFTLSVNL